MGRGIAGAFRGNATKVSITDTKIKTSQSIKDSQYDDWRLFLECNKKQADEVTEDGCDCECIFPTTGPNKATEIARLTAERNELSEEIETCHSLLDQYYSEDPAMCSADTLEQRLKLHFDELRPVITDDDVNGDD